MEKYGYSYEGSEGYCYPGTDILVNRLHIKNDAELTIAEREITSLKLLMLYKKPVLDRISFENLCKIHKVIFEDIYDWAGQIRRGDFFSKGNSIFCRGQFILENADKIIKNLNEENDLKGLIKNDFITRTAYYMGEVNALHPFREGNGRTCREFFRELSHNAGYVLDYSKTDKESLLTADIEAFNGEYENLIKILDKAISEKGNGI
jgi:cell filamentation protein